jgi:ribosomal protein L37AE/L43A
MEPSTGRRGRPPKPQPEPQEPCPCVDCEAPGVTRVDQFGVLGTEWRCRECHENLCGRAYREANRIRYG